MAVVLKDTPTAQLNAPCVLPANRSINIVDPVDFPALAGRVEEIVVHFGGVTASTEVIAVKRHTGVRASVIVRKNTIANQNLAYAA